MTEPAQQKWNPKFDGGLALIWAAGAAWQLFAGRTMLGFAFCFLALSSAVDYAQGRRPGSNLRPISFILSMIGFGLLLWFAAAAA